MKIKNDEGCKNRKNDEERRLNMNKFETTRRGRKKRKKEEEETRRNRNKYKE